MSGYYEYGASLRHLRHVGSNEGLTVWEKPCLREFGLTHVILTTGACWGGSEPRSLTPFPPDPLACAKVGFRLREAEISVENV